MPPRSVTTSRAADDIRKRKQRVTATVPSGSRATLASAMAPEYDWRERNMSTVVLAFVRALGDPALAWDVATEAIAASTLGWEAFPGGSRMAWVLEHGRRVLLEAQREGRVSSHERTRDRAAAAKTLSRDEERALRAPGQCRSRCGCVAKATNAMLC